MVPGSMEFTAEQNYLQPPEAQTDIVHVIRGVIEAESGAIDHYQRIIEFCDGLDLVTQDMVIEILRDEQEPQAPVRRLPARVRGGGTRPSTRSKDRRAPFYGGPTAEGGEVALLLSAGVTQRVLWGRQKLGRLLLLQPKP